MTKILFIGDVHIKHSNVQDLQILQDTITTCDYDISVVAGDVLDTHEKVDVQLMNRAYDLIKCLKKKSKTYILVGNHDYINNQQFLTDNHWMNGMKEWSNVVVVDYPLKIDNVIFIPYVFPGRFVEALSKLDDWKMAQVIFAHQEIRGCKMGAFISTDGDEWLEEWPLVISGHIHERQNHQKNVLYPGSIFTHAFGSSEHNPSVSIFQLDPFAETRTSLTIKIKKTLCLNVGDDIKSKNINTTTKFRIAGTKAQLDAYKKSKQYDILKKANVKVVFTQKYHHTPKSSTFETILEELINKEDDTQLFNDYKAICLDQST